MFLLTDQEDEVKSYYLDEKKGERGGEKKRLDLCMIHYLLTILHPLSPRIAHPPIRLYMHPEKLDKNAQIWLILIADWQGPQLGHLTMPMCVCVCVKHTHSSFS